MAKRIIRLFGKDFELTTPSIALSDIEFEAVLSEGPRFEEIYLDTECQDNCTEALGMTTLKERVVEFCRQNPVKIITPTFPTLQPIDKANNVALSVSVKSPTNVKFILSQPKKRDFKLNPFAESLKEICMVRNKDTIN